MASVGVARGICIFVLSTVGFFGCSDDEEAAEDPNTGGPNCCAIRAICRECTCQSDVSSLGTNDKEDACQAFLNNANNYGCDSGIRELEAIASCG